MMTVTLKINDRRIAEARLVNVTDPEESTFDAYKFHVESLPSPITGLGHTTTTGIIPHHLRKQSAWALVAKLAKHTATEENIALNKGGRHEV